MTLWNPAVSSGLVSHVHSCGFLISAQSVWKVRHWRLISLLTLSLPCHRVIQVGNYLWRSSGPTHHSKQGQLWVISGCLGLHPVQFLGIADEADFTVSLDNLCQCLMVLVILFFPYIKSLSFITTCACCFSSCYCAPPKWVCLYHFRNCS